MAVKRGYADLLQKPRRPLPETARFIIQNLRGFYNKSARIVERNCADSISIVSSIQKQQNKGNIIFQFMKQIVVSFVYMIVHFLLGNT